MRCGGGDEDGSNERDGNASCGGNGGVEGLLGEDGGGGEGVGKLAAGNVVEEMLVAYAVDNECGQGNGATSVAYFIQQVAHWLRDQGDGVNHDRYVIGGAAG